MKSPRPIPFPRPAWRTSLVAGFTPLSLLLATTPPATQLPEITVTEPADTLASTPASASAGSVSHSELELRPILRPGEVLESIPGLIVTQHSGEGKANQYYLRGFNLDHGTDFLTRIDGVPVNLPTHAHGQGWTDTGFLIPELVASIQYQKGVYAAENGDFSSAGAADIRYARTLPQSLLRLEGGLDDSFRGLYVGSPKLGSGQLLYALEGMHNNGPWQHDSRHRKGNGILRYSREDENSGWSATFMGYGASWDSTDQIPRRAVRDGTLDRFGALDPSDGGQSHRYSLSTEWHRDSDNASSRLLAYGTYTDLNLFSNFSYFLNDPIHGDQFAQPDRRWTTGAHASHTLHHHLGHADSETTLGLELRNDTIRNALRLTEARETLSTIRSDRIWQSSLSPYAANKTRWNDWFRTEAGLRADAYRFDVDSNLPANTGDRTAAIVSPKGGLVLGPWSNTELYLNGGLGFHSNDGRGALTRIDPATGDPVDRAQPLVRTQGAEIGLRSTRIRNLHSTLAFWWLDSDSELLFVGDAGSTEASRPSRRYGLEWANDFSPTPWLTLDADLCLSHARFRDHSIDPASGLPAGRHVPGAVETVASGGITFHHLGPVSAGLRFRYFGPRALLEDNSVRSRETVLAAAHLAWQINKTWSLSAEIFNLLNRKDSDIDYVYTSRLHGEPASGVDDLHFHPVEPIRFRLALTARF